MDYRIYHNENGPDIGTQTAKVIEQDGCYFKDLAGEGKLLPFEDWRLPSKERAKDLAARLSIEEISGLMMYSPHQTVPSGGGIFPAGTYDGKSLSESGKEKWELTDQQKDFLKKDHVRYVLVATLESAYLAAKWNNAVQAYVEALPYGIPVNTSSDPRHGAGGSGAEYKGGQGSVSKWPENMGIAATFDEDICRKYADVIAKEYRAMGITTALSPQVDLATEPRWMRFEDTFGTNPDSVSKLGRIYCDGLQTTEGEKDGWGRDSVCTMAKHWPGGGPCEGGRDAHYAFGKYAVYPGENFAAHLKPFTEGVFKLDGPTGVASAIMPYYTVSWNRDQKDHKNVGNSYSHYLIHDLLREEYGYEGVVCTDWGITADPDPKIDSFGSRCYGVEKLSVSERHFLAIENGVDQFGGNSEIEPILEAYQLYCNKYGEEAARKRWEESAARLLLGSFRCGLFENPYVDPDKATSYVGCVENCAAGYEAQLRSVVMLKNKQVLPFTEQPDKRKKVYIPERTIRPKKNFVRMMDAERIVDPIKTELVEQYYERVDSPEAADFAIVFIESPLSDGYSEKDLEEGGNGYVPVSLQYRPYLAEHARKVSIAGGDIREASDNRSYQGKIGTAANESDLDLVLDTKKLLKDKPVIVVLRLHNPTVLSELEKSADVILVDFGVQREAILDIVSGKAEPKGRLPIQLPKDMETVEKHCEDEPFDMEPYQDEEGNSYDYSFGLNWSGRI